MEAATVGIVAAARSSSTPHAVKTTPAELPRLRLK
jgi:hypothetical protein